MRGALDPDIAAFLGALAHADVPPIEGLTPQQARMRTRDRRDATQLPSTARVWVQDRLVPHEGARVPVRLYRPVDLDCSVPAGALVYYHGGGWTVGDLDTHDAALRSLCECSGGVVVSVDYRLAPEDRFPAAVEDSWAALRWVRAHAVSLGLDPQRIAVGGDSAGGNLAAVAALLERDAGEPPLALQLLIYPVTDLRADTASYREPADRHLLTADSMRWFISQYLADPAQCTDWRASPLLRDDLRGLPPAFILTAGFDPLRDDGRAYADRLSAACVPTQYVCFERQVHPFFTMTRITDEAQLAIQLAGCALRQAWAHTRSHAP